MLLFRDDVSITQRGDKWEVFCPGKEGQTPFYYLADSEEEALLAIEFPVLAINAPWKLKEYLMYPYMAFWDLMAGD